MKGMKAATTMRKGRRQTMRAVMATREVVIKVTRMTQKP